MLSAGRPLDHWPQAQARWPVGRNPSDASRSKTLPEHVYAPVLSVTPAVLAGVVAGAVPLLRPPGERLRAHIEHLAAGVLLAVIAFSVTYEIRQIDHLPAAIGGLVAGAAFMVAMKTVLRRFKESRGAASAMGFVAAAGIDTFIDGVLIGVAFAVRPDLAVLVLVGLGIELFVLNMSVASELLALRLRRWRSLVLTSLIALALAAGAGLGGLALSGAGPAAQTAALAFALAALLYLVAEELLLRGNDSVNSPTTTTAFFVGFIALAAYIMAAEG